MYKKIWCLNVKSKSIMHIIYLFNYLQKSYIYLKVGAMPSFSASIRAAIDICFNYNVLAKYSFKGKTKLPFIKLKLHNVIYGEYFVARINNLF